MEEMKDKTGCVNGAVPPFGTLFDAHTYVDNSLVEQGETMNFNAGLRTHSIQIKVQDYLAVENPKLGNFIQKEDPEEDI